MDTRSVSPEFGQRRRQLTTAGQQLFDDSVTKYTNKLCELKRIIDSLIIQIPHENNPVILKANLSEAYSRYEQESGDLLKYLTSYRTEAGEKEIISQRYMLQSVKVEVDNSIQKLKNTIAISVPVSQGQSVLVLPKANSLLSGASVKSKKSRSSSASSLYLQQKVKLEAAKVRHEYVEKECELVRQKTKIESDIKKLESKREVDEAECEFNVVKEYIEEGSDTPTDAEVEETTIQRVIHYVDEQWELQRNNSNELNTYGRPIPVTSYTDAVITDHEIRATPANFTMEAEQKFPVMTPSKHPNPLHLPVHEPMHENYISTSIHPIPKPLQLPVCEPMYANNIPVFAPTFRTPYDNTAPVSVAQVPLTTYKSHGSAFMPPAMNSQVPLRHIPFKDEPVTHIPPEPPQPSDNPQQVLGIQLCQEMSKFLIKKDLLQSRLIKFDDRPEFFESWKRTFKNVVSVLELSPLEEIELLQIWLGPESSNYARSIQTANGDPAIACERLWERLQDRYGRPEVLEAALKRKLALFPKLTIRDNKKLYELADIVSEIAAVKTNPRLAAQFAYFDSSSGVSPIVQKLPYGLQEKWTSHANMFKNINSSAYPPFSLFVKFLHDTAKMKNDPSFMYDFCPEPKLVSNTIRSPGTQFVKVRKTDIPIEPNRNERAQVCPLHETSHSLNMCRAFRRKPLEERKEFLKNKGICSKCCGQKKHHAKDCQCKVTCGLCKSSSHPAALHVYEQRPREFPHFDTENKNSRVFQLPVSKSNVSATCTSVCRNPLGTSKSCAKTILVRVYPADEPKKELCLYARIDELSNRSLAKPTFFDYFNVHGPDIPYSLSSCSGVFQQSGRRASGLTVESMNSSCSLRLPTIIECDQLPDARDEIPSPEAAKAYKHMYDIAEEIPPLNPDAEILLLIGRDLLPAHHVLDQRLGKNNTPYAQQLRLGWVVIGEACLGATHEPDAVSAYKTFTLIDGRASLLQPCQNNLLLKEIDVFIKTDLDDTPGLSVEDKKFLHIMETGITKDYEGCWSMPLPFKEHRSLLPKNRIQALKRANLLTSSLNKNPQKRNHVIEFMQKIFSNGHAEIAPPLAEDEEHWYLPLFAVYHPKKPDKVRCVFDSSAKCQ